MGAVLCAFLGGSRFPRLSPVQISRNGPRLSDRLRAGSRGVLGGAPTPPAGVNPGATPGATHPASRVTGCRHRAHRRTPQSARHGAEIRATKRDWWRRSATGEIGSKGTSNPKVAGSIPARRTTTWAPPSRVTTAGPFDREHQVTGLTARGSFLQTSPEAPRSPDGGGPADACPRRERGFSLRLRSGRCDGTFRRSSAVRAEP